MKTHRRYFPKFAEDSRQFTKDIPKIPDNCLTVLVILRKISEEDRKMFRL